MHLDLGQLVDDVRRVAQLDPVQLQVGARGEVAVALVVGARDVGQPVQLAGLVDALKPLTPNGTDDRVYVRGDTAANYGAVMQVMGVLSQAGYAKIGLITDQAQDQAR